MAWSEEHRIDESDASVLIRRGTQEQADGNPEEAESLFRDAERVLTSALERAETDARTHRPEVATVLASLAAVRHALGNYISAEELYRQALSIREKTLTPNHITTAATMESLAETCAARGGFAEAVALCHRALSIREATRGANDASVRVARERIAGLQLEAQEESRVTTPPRASPAQQATRPVDAPLVKSTPLVGASSVPAVLAPWANELAAVREEIEATAPAVAHDRPLRRSAHATHAGVRSPTAIVVAAGVTVLLVALGYMQFANKPDRSAFAEAEPFNPAARRATQQANAATVIARESPSPSDSLAVALERPRPQAPPPSVAVVPPPSRANAKAPSTPISDVPGSRAGNPLAKPVADSAAARAAVPPVEKAPEPRGRGEFANAPTSPTLIGTAPQPAYPEALRDQQVEGEVVVQFVVDETGKADVATLTVVRSPHVLLTNAVRALLPQFRFEPARTAPPQSIPRPETVRYAYTFRAPRR